jgi:glyceraldehyde-3-phosphate dehydrogenase (NADP+)
MLDEAGLTRLFPRESDIPAEHRLIAPINQASTLHNGELKPIEGGVRPVFSPVCVQDDSGGLRQLEIGSVPVGSIAEAEAALQAAVDAYDSGRGEWPTMTVAQRIACMQDFTQDGRAAPADRKSDHVGDRQDAVGFGKRV